MENEIDYAKIGERIKAIRLKKGISQQKLADRIGVTQSAVSHLEIGMRGLHLEPIIQIANAFEISVDELLGSSVKISIDKYDSMAKEMLDDCSKQEREFLLKGIKHIKGDFREYVDDIVEEKLEARLQDSKADTPPESVISCNLG